MASPLRRQVRSETRLRYGGSLTDLLSARRTAHHQYTRDVDAAVESAGAIKQASRQAIPELKRIYNEADKTRSAAAEQIDQAINLAGTPHGALAQALMGERGAAQTRFAEERAAAQSENVARGRDAVAGLVYQKRNALDNYRSTRADLMGKTRDVHREMGAFAQGRLGELQTQQAQAEFEQQKFAETQRHNIASEDIQAGVNPRTGAPLQKPRTQAEQRQVAKDTASATAEINRARVWLRQLTAKGGSPDVIKNLLVQGGSLPTTIEYSGTNSKGEKVKKVRTKDISVPAFEPDYVRAAFELEGSGYLSDHSLHSLRATHNVHVPNEWLSTPGRKKTNRATTKLTGTAVQGTKKIADALALR